jgi:hypothetical protein
MKTKPLVRIPNDIYNEAVILQGKFLMGGQRKSIWECIDIVRASKDKSSQDTYKRLRL